MTNNEIEKRYAQELWWTVNPLRHYRCRQGLSQKDIAAQVGIDPRNYQRWEVGDRLPTLPRIVVLAEALGLMPEYLAARFIRWHLQRLGRGRRKPVLSCAWYNS